MDTLVVYKATKEDLELLINIAQRMGIDIQLVPKEENANRSEKETDEAIMKLSKKVNKGITKRWFKEMGADYDSYSRQ